MITYSPKQCRVRVSPIGGPPHLYITHLPSPFVHTRPWPCIPIPNHPTHPSHSAQATYPTHIHHGSRRRLTLFRKTRLFPCPAERRAGAELERAFEAGDGAAFFAVVGVVGRRSGGMHVGGGYNDAGRLRRVGRVEVR